MLLGLYFSDKDDDDEYAISLWVSLQLKVIWSSTLKIFGKMLSTPSPMRGKFFYFGNAPSYICTAWVPLIPFKFIFCCFEIVHRLDSCFPPFWETDQIRDTEEVWPGWKKGGKAHSWGGREANSDQTEIWLVRYENFDRVFYDFDRNSSRRK